ncbi:undecaprenyl-diphosphate phosphatase [Candidatus Dojkabacteria bacterium]|nr:undecaprenyl-diphosphate phosphatase [Candidatus Dojkabacteria bacterium]
MVYQEFAYTLIAGIIQGITEVLPVSSSGHLIIVSEIFDHSLTLSEIAVLHLGTLVAIIIVTKDKFKHLKNPKVLFNILLSIIPAGVIGFFFDDLIEETLHGILVITLSLIFWGIVMILTDQRTKKSKFKINEINEITPKESIIVGLGQCLAFIPGTSRSGITTLFGIFSGISPDTALSFSFLSGIPLIAASGFFSVIDMISEKENTMNLPSILIALITSLVTGIIAGILLKKFIKKGILTVCGVYRIILAIVLFSVFLL